jgi:hypothetical protein
MYPQGLRSIIELFETLPDQERRDALISYADQARKWGPKEGESFDLEDVRKDAPIPSVFFCALIRRIGLSCESLLALRYRP